MVENEGYIGSLALEISKGRGRVIRAGWKRYKGADFFDIREFIGGAYTKLGVTLPLNLVKPFANALLLWCEVQDPSLFETDD